MIKVDDKTFVLEYDGCYTHGCEDCGYVSTESYILVGYHFIYIKIKTVFSRNNKGKNVSNQNLITLNSSE